MSKWFALFNLREKDYTECRHDKLIMLLTQANYYNLKDLDIYYNRYTTSMPIFFCC